MTIENNRRHGSWTSVWYSRLVVRHITAGLLAIAVFAFHPGDSGNSRLSAQEQPDAIPATQTAASADGQTPQKSASIAVRRMDSARQMLEAQVTGKLVQQLQRQIVDDLRELLKQRPANAPQNQPRPQEASTPTAAQNHNQTPPKTTDAGAAQNTPQQNQQPQDSTDRTDPETETQAELQKRERLIQGVWGHLKPELRREFLKLADERNLPQYNEMIQRYYRSLGESID